MGAFTLLANRDCDHRIFALVVLLLLLPLCLLDQPSFTGSHQARPPLPASSLCGLGPDSDLVVSLTFFFWIATVPVMNVAHPAL